MFVRVVIHEISWVYRSLAARSHEPFSILNIRHILAISIEESNGKITIELLFCKKLYNETALKSTRRMKRHCHDDLNPCEPQKCSAPALPVSRAEKLHPSVQHVALTSSHLQTRPGSPFSLRISVLICTWQTQTQQLTLFRLTGTASQKFGLRLRNLTGVGELTSSNGLGIQKA
jgi:hypothetical protein